MFESMIYADKQIICHDCGTAFTFTAKEQEQFASIGHVNAPKRCLPCRTKRKKATSKSNSFAAGGSGKHRQRNCPQEDICSEMFLLWERYYGSLYTRCQ